MTEVLSSRGYRILSHGAAFGETFVPAVRLQSTEYFVTTNCLPPASIHGGLGRKRPAARPRLSASLHSNSLLGGSPLNRIARLAIALALGLSSAAAIAAVVPAPSAPAEKTLDTIQGEKVADPYRWLENWSDPKVVAWSDAENVRTRSYLDPLPARGATKDRLTKLIKATSPSYSSLYARGSRVFAIFSDPANQQPLLVTLTASADPNYQR